MRATRLLPHDGSSGLYMFVGIGFANLHNMNGAIVFIEVLKLDAVVVSDISMIVYVGFQPRT